MEFSSFFLHFSEELKKIKTNIRKQTKNDFSREEILKKKSVLNAEEQTKHLIRNSIEDILSRY